MCFKCISRGIYPLLPVVLCFFWYAVSGFRIAHQSIHKHSISEHEANFYSPVTKGHVREKGSYFLYIWIPFQFPFFNCFVNSSLFLNYISKVFFWGWLFHCFFMNFQHGTFKAFLPYIYFCTLICCKSQLIISMKEFIEAFVTIDAFEHFVTLNTSSTIPNTGTLT